MSVLCYHAVDPCWESPLAVTPDAFVEQLEWLSRHRTVVPLSTALDRMDARGRLPKGMVALTFDDGFAQLQEHVFPTLARFGMPATVFVVAATLTPEGQDVDWVDTPPPDWELDTLTPEQVVEAAAQGVDIGSHTWAHLRLPELDEDACRTDLRQSRDLLEDLLHRPVPYLAYPRGLHDAGTRRAAADAGYDRSFALPTSAEEPGPHAVPRVGVFPGNGTLTLRGKTHPSYLPVRHSPVFPPLRRLARR